MNPRTLTLAWALSGALLGGGLVAQERAPARPTPPPTQVFSEVLEVRVVNLEVVVTDRDGNRVTGLPREDFELIVDGEPRPIGYFTEVREGLAMGNGGAQGISTATAGEVVANQYLVFVDEYFTITRDRDRVLDHLLEQLSLLGERDRMAVVRFNGDAVEPVTTWTAGDALRDALASVKRRPTAGLRREAQLRGSLPTGRALDVDARVGTGGGQLSLEERYYVEKLEEQVDRSVSAVVSTLRTFVAPPGRKVLLLLAGGWPWDPAEFVIDDPNRLILEPGIRHGGEALEPLRDTANLLGYTIYAVDVPGSQDLDGNSAADDFPRQGGFATSFFRESNVHHSLQAIARDTGGQALLNSARNRVLEAAAEDVRTFYWLGFDAERLGDDLRHDLEVRVKRPGLKVRSRSDYFDFSRSREVTMLVESALRFGTPPSPNPLLVRMGRAVKSGLRAMLVPLEIQIPAANLTFLPGPQGFESHVELRVAVLDDRGATTETPVIPFVLRAEKQPAATDLARYDTQLKLRRRGQRLVVAIYDVASGTISSAALEVEPGS